MGKRYASCMGIMALSTTSLFADFSYRETSKITGGMVAGMMKIAGAFSKAAREPMDATVAVKGNKLVHRGSTHMSLIDLDAKTITTVDLQKKQYSVMTFEEMRQAMENMAKKMKQDSSADMKMRVSAEPTGKTKEISGYNAKEVLMKISMDIQDQKSKQSGSMVVYTDLWIAENVAGYSEIAGFYKRMSEQLNWTPGGGMFMQQPEIAKGMAEAFKEVSKMNGAPVFQKVSMGPEGMAPPNADAPAPAAEQKQQQPKPNVGNAIGGALGGRLGGLGGLGRKKQQDPPPQEQSQQQPPPQQGSGATGSMIEMETTYSNFAPTADASLFDIPAGFKQVESDMKKIK
jgi:hypothetical protein